MSRNYKFHNPSGKYFVSFAVVHWLDVFVREEYMDCIVKNLNYCVANKGMVIYGWCLLSSHIHLIFMSEQGKPAELLRDFKSYTAKQLILLIKENPQESRKEWLLNAFEKAGIKNSNNTNNQFWQQNNHPIEIWSNKVFEQKLDYIHSNPVVSGFVKNIFDWKYSSAIDYCGNKGMISICLEG